MAHADTTHAIRGNAAMFSAAVVLFVGLVVLIAGLLGADWLLRADNFPVRQVRFEGEFRHVTQPQLEAAVMDAVRGNFLRLDLAAIRARAEKLPWVHEAAVRRQWPFDVHIRFTEHKLLARWNETAWVNQAGRAVRVPDTDHPRDLPWLDGPEGTSAQVYSRYQGLSRILAAAGLRLMRLALTPRRTWRIELEGGLVLILDRDQPEHKVERFARLYPQLAHEARRFRVVDLRYTNGFAVEWKAHRAAPGTANEG
jgi:cell division protein FtsQ